MTQQRAADAGVSVGRKGSKRRLVSFSFKSDDSPPARRSHTWDNQAKALSPAASQEALAEWSRMAARRRAPVNRALIGLATLLALSAHLFFAAPPPPPPPPPRGFMRPPPPPPPVEGRYGGAWPFALIAAALAALCYSEGLLSNWDSLARALPSYGRAAADVAAAAVRSGTAAAGMVRTADPLLWARQASAEALATAHSTARGELRRRSRLHQLLVTIVVGVALSHLLPADPAPCASPLSLQCKIRNLTDAIVRFFEGVLRLGRPPPPSLPPPPQPTPHAAAPLLTIL